MSNPAGTPRLMAHEQGATRAGEDAGEPRKKNGDEKCFEDLVHSRRKREAATPGLGGLPTGVSVEGGDVRQSYLPTLVLLSPYAGASDMANLCHQQLISVNSRTHLFRFAAR